MWNELLKSLRSEAEPKKAQASTRPMDDPKIMDAQRRATSHYFRTGESRPLDDFKRDPNLK
jgi:hypothetical protein